MRDLITTFCLITMIALAGCGSGGGGGGGNSAGSPPAGGPGNSEPPPVTLLGTTFAAATSRQLFTELTLPSSQTWVTMLDAESTDPATVIRAYSADTQRGIACVKVEETGQEPIWYAKDTAGRVIAIQEENEDGTLDQPTTIEETFYFPTQNLTVGAFWLNEAGTEWKVEATDATAPRSGRPGCTQFRLTFGTETTDESDDLSYLIWWSNAKGEVEGGYADFLETNWGYEYLTTPSG